MTPPPELPPLSDPTPQSPTPQSPTPQSKGSLFIIFLTVFIDLLGFGIVLPLLPIYAKELDVDAGGWTIGVLMGSFSAMQFLFAPVWGRLSDRYGRRPILLLGLTGSVIFYAMFGVATAMGSLVWIFVSRFGAGIAGATIPTAQAYIADSTTKENRTRGMALIGAAFGLGFTFGPLLAATALFTAGEEGTSPWPGYTAAGLSAFALILALLKLPESRQPDSSPSAHRLFDLKALGQALSIPTVGALLLTSFVSVLSFASFESILSFLLKEPPKDGGGGFGFDLIDVLLLFGMVGFIHALGQGMVRRMAKTMSEGKLATLGAVTSIAGFVLLAIATSSGSLPLLLSGMIVESAGFAFIPASLNSLISRRSDPSRQGGILGVAQSLSSLARIGGHVVSFPLFYLAATAPFWTSAGLMTVAAILITIYARRGRDYESPG